MTSYLTSYLASYVVSDLTRLLYEVLKVTLRGIEIGLENAALGLGPLKALSRPQPQSYSIWTDPKPANNLLYFFPPSHMNVFILSLPPAQTRRALQMKYTN